MWNTSANGEADTTQLDTLSVICSWIWTEVWQAGDAKLANWGGSPLSNSQHYALWPCLYFKLKMHGLFSCRLCILSCWWLRCSYPPNLRAEMLTAALPRCFLSRGYFQSEFISVHRYIGQQDIYMYIYYAFVHFFRKASLKISRVNILTLNFEF